MKVEKQNATTASKKDTSQEIALKAKLIAKKQSSATTAMKLGTSQEIAQVRMVVNDILIDF